MILFIELFYKTGTVITTTSNSFITMPISDCVWPGLASSAGTFSSSDFCCLFCFQQRKIMPAEMIMKVMGAATAIDPVVITAVVPVL